eukprot:jgi/Ulvmu1/7311/UM035_0100.1
MPANGGAAAVRGGQGGQAAAEEDRIAVPAAWALVFINAEGMANRTNDVFHVCIIAGSDRLDLLHAHGIRALLSKTLDSPEFRKALRDLPLNSAEINNMMNQRAVIARRNHHMHPELKMENHAQWVANIRQPIEAARVRMQGHPQGLVQMQMRLILIAIDRFERSLSAFRNSGESKVLDSRARILCAWSKSSRSLPAMMQTWNTSFGRFAIPSALMKTRAHAADGAILSSSPAAWPPWPPGTAAAPPLARISLSSSWLGQTAQKYAT